MVAPTLLQYLRADCCTSECRFSLSLLPWFSVALRSQAGARVSFLVASRFHLDPPCSIIGVNVHVAVQIHADDATQRAKKRVGFWELL